MRVHYPRTPHLPWSPGATADDVRTTDLGGLRGREVVVTEGDLVLVCDLNDASDRGRPPRSASPTRGPSSKGRRTAHRPSTPLSTPWRRSRRCPVAPPALTGFCFARTARVRPLDEAGVAQAQAWPRPFESGPAGAGYAIGLGRTPPDRTALEQISARWLIGLPGVRITWTENGAVPTLR